LGDEDYDEGKSKGQQQSPLCAGILVGWLKIAQT